MIHAEEDKQQFILPGKIITSNRFSVDGFLCFVYTEWHQQTAEQKKAAAILQK